MCRAAVRLNSCTRGQSTVRVALGASPLQVLRLVVAGGLAPVGAGIGVGVVTTMMLGRLLDTILFDVRATDGLTLALSALTLLATGALGSWWPARRAARTAPTAALRE